MMGWLRRSGRAVLSGGARLSSKRRDPLDWMKVDPAEVLREFSKGRQSGLRVASFLSSEDRKARGELVGLERESARLYSEMLGLVAGEGNAGAAAERMGRYEYWGQVDEERGYALRRRRVDVKGEGEEEEEEEVVSWVELVEAFEGHYRRLRRKMGVSLAEFERRKKVVVGMCRVSPDDRFLAVTAEMFESHDERFVLFVKDLLVGKMMYISPLEHNVAGIAWFQGEKVPALIFSLCDEESRRPFQVWVGQLQGGLAHKEMLYEEKDPEYYVDLTSTKDNQVVLLNSISKDATEVRVIERTGSGSWTTSLISERKIGVQYYVEHRHGSLYAVSNANQATEFQLLKFPRTLPIEMERCQVIMPENPDALIEDAEFYDGSIVLYQRNTQTTRPMISVIQENAKDAVVISVDIPDRFLQVTPGVNQDYGASSFRFHASSPLHPVCTYEYDISSRTLSLLSGGESINPAISEFISRHSLQCRQVFVPSHDGEVVPLTLLYSQSKLSLDGSNPCLINVYGCYGTNLDLSYNPKFLPLLSRGWIIAFAHVRGGSERGRRWYDQGRRLYKKNSIRDLESCILYLHREKFSSPARTCAIASSAGSLVLASTLVQNPDLVQSAVLRYPFLDLVGTMLDPELPLTTHEYSEWGNPTSDRQALSYLSDYDPCLLLERLDELARFPHVWVQTSLLDCRAPFWNSSKFVSRLRELLPASSTVLLTVSDTTGHFGESGSLQGDLSESSLEFAFLSHNLG